MSISVATNCLNTATPPAVLTWITNRLNDYSPSPSVHSRGRWSLRRPPISVTVNALLSRPRTFYSGPPGVARNTRGFGSSDTITSRAEVGHGEGETWVITFCHSLEGGDGESQRARGSAPIPLGRGQRTLPFLCASSFRVCMLPDSQPLCADWDQL